MRAAALLLVSLLMGGIENLYARESTVDLKPPANESKVSKLENSLPEAFAWYEKSEEKLLAQGRKLSKIETRTAIALGAAHPERIRVVVLRNFPMPTKPIFIKEAKRFGFGSRFEIGRTMGYAIPVKPQEEKDPTVVAHELVHVAQQDRLGRQQFVRQILTEPYTIGYEESPLEIEAYAKQGIKVLSP
jgi:hypothetical protein